MSGREKSGMNNIFLEKCQWINYRDEWVDVTEDAAVQYLQAVINNTMLNCGVFDTVDFEFIIYLGQKFYESSQVQDLMASFNRKIYEGVRYKSKLAVAAGHTKEQESHINQLLGKDRSVYILNNSYFFAARRPYTDYRPLK